MAPYPSFNKASFEHGYKIAELAAGRVQSQNLGGKRQATGDITFTGQPITGDVFTINGVAVTARTAGAVSPDFNIGADLTSSITALVGVLNASANANLSKATYSNVGGTKLHILFDTYGSAGNAFTLAEVSASASVSAAALTGGTDADVLSLDAETKALSTVAGSTVTEFDLPAGEEGQETTLYLAIKGAGSNAQINGAFGGGTKLTLDTAGKFAKLKYFAGIAAWAQIAGTGALS
jgi:hypothetical protein